MWFKKSKNKDEKQSTNEEVKEQTAFAKEVESAKDINMAESAAHQEQSAPPLSKSLEQATGESQEELKKQFELFKIQKILRRIDHTLLRHDITRDELKKLCSDALHYGFYTVCVHPVNVDFVKRQLGSGAKVKVCAVVGFPFGENTTAVKAYETKKAIADGADEIDMVISVSAVKRGDFRFVKKDIRAVVKAAKNRTVKVIIETSLLTVKEMEQCCLAIISAGARFVKTSTGYFGDGASVNVVSQLKNYVKDKLSVKASGGIKSSDDAVALLNAGADRLGTSNGVAIAEGLKTQSGY